MIVICVYQNIIIQQEGVIVENLNKTLYNLYNQELSDLMIGYNFNSNRIEQMMDLVAQIIYKQPYITELFE